ncbi:hypothetical protein MMC11_008873 [Xylographa trunciseda]|nr:hypothetical protein [Xylographa trunciseda]
MPHPTASIPIVAIGRTRPVAEGADAAFAGTPYRTAAIVDFTSEPAAYTYSAHNLGVVLQNLHPRPRVVICGTGLSHETADEAIEVWDTYVKSWGVTETLVINLARAAQDAGGDWMAEIMRRLDEKYRPQGHA